MNGMTSKLCAMVAISAIAVTLCQTAHASPGLATGEPYPVPFVRIFLGLLVSLMVALIAILALRRLKTGHTALPSILKEFVRDRPDALIEILESRRMNQHGEASLIACNGVHYLIVATAGQAIVVDRFEISNNDTETEANDATR